MDDEEISRNIDSWPPDSLDGMSVAALKAYRAELEAELVRVSQNIDIKEKYLSSADSLFRKSGRATGLQRCAAPWGKS